MPSSYAFVCCGYTKDGTGELYFTPPLPDQGHYGFQKHYPPDIRHSPPYPSQYGRRPLDLPLLLPSSNYQPSGAPMMAGPNLSSSLFGVYPSPSPQSMVVPPIAFPSPVRTYSSSIAEETQAVNVVRAPSSSRDDWRRNPSPMAPAWMPEARFKPYPRQHSPPSRNSEEDHSYAPPIPHQMHGPLFWVPSRNPRSKQVKPARRPPITAPTPIRRMSGSSAQPNAGRVTFSSLSPNVETPATPGF